MSHGVRIAVTSHKVRRAALMLALALTTAMPARSRAEQAAGKESSERRVVPTHRDFKLKDAGTGAERAAKIAIYRVEQVKDGSLLLAPDGGQGGWADAGQVVSVEKAVEFFSVAIGKSPRDPYNYAMRAMVLLLERGDPAHALEDCESAIRLDPRFAFARGIRGAVRAATQDLDKAIADFSEVIRLTPREPDAYRDRGIARMSNQDFDGSIADFNEAIRLDPQESATFVLRASAWLSKKEGDRAMADVNEALRLDPKNADAFLLRASFRGQQGEFDQAIADFTQLIKLSPDVPMAYEARGTGWRHKKDYDRAIADFTQAIRLDPTNVGAYIARGLTWRDQRQDDKAIADLDQAIRLDPQNPDAYGVRGDAWADKKDFGKAIVDFTQVIKLDPRNAWAYASRGLAEAERQQYDRAVADLDQALKLEPNNPDALNGRAWFRATCPIAKYRNGAQAVAAATKACEVSGHKEPGLLDTLAAAYAESGDFDSALKWEAKAIELETDAKEKAEYGERLKLYSVKKPYHVKTETTTLSR
jgi:tetratricopeptide (TPR) repeat protein